LLVAVGMVWLRLDPVGVAKQTRGADRPSGQEAGGKAGREVPELFLRVPANRALEEVAIPHCQVGKAMGARADGVVDFQGGLADRIASCGQRSSMVPDVVPLAIHAEAYRGPLEDGEGVVMSSVVLLPGGYLGNGGNGAPHRMLVERGRFPGMAFG